MKRRVITITVHDEQELYTDSYQLQRIGGRAGRVIMLEESVFDGSIAVSAEQYVKRVIEKEFAGLVSVACRPLGQIDAEKKEETVSERCKRTNVQDCHICENLACGDNESERFGKEVVK